LRKFYKFLTKIFYRKIINKTSFL